MRKTLIKKGRLVIEHGLMSRALEEGLSDTVLEIAGATSTDYYGTAELEDIQEKEDRVDQIKYYKYEAFGLQECSFGQAIATDEFRNENLLIFSEASDQKPYIAELVNID